MLNGSSRVLYSNFFISPLVQDALIKSMRGVLHVHDTEANTDRNSLNKLMFFEPVGPIQTPCQMPIIVPAGSLPPQPTLQECHLPRSLLR
jgi:hypothetical protein